MKLIKRLTIALGMIILFEFIVTSLVSLPKHPATKIQPNPIQTTQPFYYHQPAKSTLSVITTSPKDLGTNVATDKAIAIQFNTSFDPQIVSVSFAPTFAFQTKVIKDTLFIFPTHPLLSNLSYYGFVSISGLPTYTFSFTTVHDAAITTAPDYANEIQTQINKHNYPDAYLSGFTPYTTSSFTVISSYTTDKPEHFFFIVTLFGDKAQATQDFISWATGTGLTTQQLETMDIRYN